MATAGGDGLGGCPGHHPKPPHATNHHPHPMLPVSCKTCTTHPSAKTPILWRKRCIRKRSPCYWSTAAAQRTSSEKRPSSPLQEQEGHIRKHWRCTITAKYFPTPFLRTNHTCTPLCTLPCAPISPKVMCISEVRGRPDWMRWLPLACLSALVISCLDP